MISNAHDFSGLVSDGTGTILSSTDVSKLANQKLFIPDPMLPPKFIFVVVDPSAGGSSEYSMMAFINHYGQKVVSFF